jgi:hypothetical protein
MSTRQTNTDHPAPCLGTVIAFAAAVILIAGHSSRAAIYRCDLDGKVVYHVEMGCCDQLNPLYDAYWNFICCPDGGFTGHGDGSCPSGMTFCGCMQVDSSVKQLVDSACSYSVNTAAIRITRLAYNSYNSYVPQFAFVGESVPAPLRNREWPIDEVLGLCGKMETLRIKQGNTYACTLWTLEKGQCWPLRVRLAEPFSLSGLDTARQWIYPDTAAALGKTQFVFFDYRFNCRSQFPSPRISVQGGTIVINYWQADIWQCDGPDKHLYGLQVSLDSLKEGIYPVFVRDSGEAQAHLVDTLYVIGSSAVKEPRRLPQENRLRVKLNGRILRIEGLDGKSIKTDIQIYGINGALWFEGTARPQSIDGRAAALLKVPDLPAGTYMIVIHGDCGQGPGQSLMYVNILSGR